MATSVLSMILETKKRGNAGPEVTRELQGVTRSLGQMVGLGGNILTFAGMFYGLRTAARATIGELQTYAGEVRDLSGITGQGAEESSRLLQVLDDFEIQGGQLTAAMRAMRTQELSPTIDTLADLSDQYLALAPGVERMTFLQTNFGRSGADFALVMSQGGAAIRERGQLVEQGLILDERMLQESEALRQGMDDLTDRILAGKIAMGVMLTQGIVPLVEGLERADRVTAAYRSSNQGSLPPLQTLTAAERAHLHQLSQAIEQSERLTRHSERLNETNETLGQSTAELWQHIQDEREAMGELGDATQGAVGPSDALRSALEGVDTGLANMIEGFRDSMAWISGGGLQLQGAAESVMAAFRRGAITEDEANELLRPIEAAALGLQVDIGQITISDATRTMWTDWGGTLTTARGEIRNAQADIENLPEEVRTQIRVAVQWQITGGLGRHEGFQHGGTFTVEGPPGVDRVPVMFMATAGEPVTVGRPGQAPGASGASVHFHGPISLGGDLDLAKFEKMLVRTLRG